jgi:alpha-tubulin suppressor-like RCC1 family protein
MACDVIDIAAGDGFGVLLLRNNTVETFYYNSIIPQITLPSKIDIINISAGRANIGLIKSSGQVSSNILQQVSGGFSPRIISVNNLPPGLQLVGSLKPINTGEIKYDPDGLTFFLRELTGNIGYEGPLFKEYEKIYTKNKIGISGFFATGKNNFDQSTDKISLTGISSIYAGQSTNIAILNENNKITGWGANFYGERLDQIQSFATGIKSASIKSFHTLLLFNNNTISGFGLDIYGQATNGNNLTGVSGVSVGLNHSVALLNNGKITGWGDNTNLQTSGTSGFYDWNSTPVGQITGSTKIAAGLYHNITLLNNKTITGWGNNNYNKISDGYNLTGVINISAGENHSIALLANGKVTGWGDNSYGQVSGGISNYINWNSTPVGILTGVIDISAGYNHNLALLANGKVTGWGLNSDKQIFNISSNTLLTGVYGISAGLNHSLFALKLSDITTQSFGANPLQITGNITGFGITGYNVGITGYTTDFYYGSVPNGFNTGYLSIQYSISGIPRLPGTYNTYLLIDELGNNTRFAERYISFVVPNDKRFPTLYKVCGGASLGFIDKRLT